MNELGAKILAVMESSTLGKMSVHVLTKQSKDIGVDLDRITEEDILPLADKLSNVLPFFLGEETKTVLAGIRKLADDGVSVIR